MLGSEIVEQLGVVVLEVPQPGVPSCRGVIRGLGKGIVAFKTDVVTGTLLEANL